MGWGPCHRARHAYARLQIRRRGFWFVDIPRTSSSSIRAELGRRYGVVYGKRNVREREHATGQIFGDHHTALEMRSILGPRLWDRVFTFSFVRNPWARTLSLYAYRRLENDLPADLGFRDYVRSLRRARSGGHALFECPHLHRSASEYLFDDDGAMLVDFVGRYEDRARDIAHVGSRIGFEGLGRLKIQVASPAGQSYVQAYDHETREIVGELYARDIEAFGYRFDA